MKLFQRCYQVTFIIFFVSASSLFGMVMDNRYFPWFSYVYNGSDHRHGCLRVDPFFITASSSWNVSGSVKEREYGYPNLQGSLDYYNLAQALELYGIENPIPAEWQYVHPFPIDMPGSFEGQGISFTGYVPLTNHIAIGGSIFFLRLVTQAHIIASQDVASKLVLSAAGNQAEFNALTRSFESLVATHDGYWTQSGPSDFELYIRAFDVREYVYWCRKIDASAALGLLIPTGVQSSIYNIGSVPFGGNGFWGWYFSPTIEFELKEDWKAGCELRIEKRFARTLEHRICIAEESNLFAPVIGSLYINPGVTACFSPYLALENMREGLGILFKYVYVVHEKDYFEDKRVNPTPTANFSNMIDNSRWAQEYISLELCYDISYNHTWSYRPICTLLWDIPLNVLGARGSSKTTRVAVGLMVDF